jgi:intein/homing endonuclease
MTWVDGKTLQKKVKDLQVGDKVVSYTFAELPENDSEYSLSAWNSQSMTPLEVKEATVVTNEKLVTQSTVFFNGDKNNRMSLEHLVFIKRDGVYSIVLAGLVEVGDTILKIDEESLTIYEEAISSIEHVNEQTEIYKLDVTPYDIFFGGNMLTHNKGFFY